MQYMHLCGIGPSCPSGTINDPLLQHRQVELMGPLPGVYALTCKTGFTPSRFLAPPFLSSVGAKVSLKVEPKIVKIGSRRVFCVTEKTLNSASVFFRAFTVSGTPGPSPIVNFPCKYHNFRDATLSQKIMHFFTKLCQNWSLRRPLKPLEISKT